MQFLSFDSVDSTNELAKRLVREGAIRGTACVAAREQTAGRGQYGRTWVSPRDAGLYLSVVELFASERPAPTTAYTMASGVACVEALDEATGATVRIKPVNDLVCLGGKLGGILTETVIEGGAVALLITGVGINVANVPRPVSADAALPPISLEEVLPRERYRDLARDALVERLALGIARLNALVTGGQVERVRESWNRLLIAPGKGAHPAKGGGR